MTLKKAICRFKLSGKSKTGKTKIWRVMEPGGAYEIGYIKWHGAWRCYVFEPLAFTIYESKCLRAIADFCEAESTKTRKGWAKKKT